LSTQQYDVLVLGSGAGGKFMAWHMANEGHRTAVVERRWIGGSCPNVSCLPSKNEIWSAKVVHLARRAKAFGITTGPTAIDMAGVRQRKRQMVDDLVALHEDLYRTNGAELIIRIIQDNLAGGSRSTRARLVPYCVFTDPPLARVGLSEQEARERGIAARVARRPMNAVLSTRTLGETAGFMKVLVEATGDRILGSWASRCSARKPGRSWRRSRPRCWVGSRTPCSGTRSSRTPRWRRD